jgi:hypothetical protein
MALGMFEQGGELLDVPSVLEYVSDVPPWAANILDTWESLRIGTPTLQPAFYPGPSPVPVSVKDESFIFDFYYRIWVFPLVLELRNPRTGVDIPFDLWNAYPDHNTLLSINSTGSEGLTLDISAGAVFHEIEYRTVNIQIGATAPLAIDATFTFNFEQGSVTFTFVATRASVLAIIPDVPVHETWNWLTDVMVSNDGTEQRVALRSSPRRSQQARLVATTEGLVKERLKQFQFDLMGLIVVPYFQYATELTADTPIGGTDLTFDPSRTDVREGEYIYCLKRDGSGELVKVLLLGPNGATLSTPVTLDLTKGTLVAPAFTSIVRGKAGVNRYAVKDAAEIDLRTEASSVRVLFSRPGSLASIVTYDGYPVLTERPLANELLKEEFDTGAEIFDYETGYTEIVARWDYTKVQGDRKFLVHRYTEPVKMDYWRDFLGGLGGRLNPFLMPSWRDDHAMAVPVLELANTFVLVGSDYATLYWPMNPHKRLVLHTTVGDLYVTVTAASVDVDGNSVCTISGNIPIGYANVTSVSYLLKLRLQSDEVKLEHYGLDTYLSLSVRTVPE